MAEGGESVVILRESATSEQSLDIEQTPSLGSSSPRLSRKARDSAVADNEPKEDDPDNYPLNTPWTFWHDLTPRGATAKDYFKNLKQLCTVKTIKAFWGVVNNIRPVNELGNWESYHLMRSETRRPTWEDLDNAHGGVWTIKIHKSQTARVWQELMLAAVGEQFSECMAEGDCVCGVSVRIKSYDQDTVQIWNEDSELHYNASVIQKLKELIPDIEINEFYQSNRAKVEDAAKKSMSNVQHRGFSPPSMFGGQRRFTGGPPPMHSMYPPPPHIHPHYPPPPGMFPPHPRQFPPRQFRPSHP